MLKRTKCPKPQTQWTMYIVPESVTIGDVVHWWDKEKRQHTSRVLKIGRKWIIITDADSRRRVKIHELKIKVPVPMGKYA